MSDIFHISIESDNENYLFLRNNQYHPLRQYCEKLWGKFEPYADRNFREDFARDLHTRFWEMYLANQLLELGFQLEPRQKKVGPDLHLVIDKRHIWIEATAPKQGEGVDAVNYFIPREPGQLPEDRIILRFLSTISEKRSQLEHYLIEGIISPEDPYIIAINGRGIGVVMTLQTFPLILNAVFGLGDQVIYLDPQNLEIVDKKFEHRPEVIKQSGASVSTLPFFDPAYAGISGIIYSDAALRDPPTSPNDEFIYIHNFLAKNPLDKGWLKAGKDWLIEDNRLTSYPD